jgi:hypothetical protein
LRPGDRVRRAVSLVGVNLRVARGRTGPGWRDWLRLWPWRVAACALLAPAAAMATPPDGEAGWRERWRDDEADITVWLRDRPDGLPEFLAVTRVPARLQALVALLQDTAAMPRWVYRTREVQVLEAPDPMRGLVRVLTAMPWPLSDREAIVDWRLTQDQASAEVRLEGHSAGERLAPLEGVVRMPQFGSSWRFVPRNGDSVEVRFTGHGHLGGNLGYGPLQAFVNSAAWVAPYETVKALRVLVQQPPYRDARVAGIREPR